LRILLSVLYEKLNTLSGGTLKIIVTTIRRFLKARAFEVAASMSYYFFFSLFPLLIFLVALGSYVLEAEQVRTQVFEWLVSVFPTATDMVERNIDLVIARRGTASLTATIGLLWAGSGAFAAVERNVNRAWPNAQVRHFLHGRLIALLMIILLAVLLFLSLFSSTVAHVLSQFHIPLWDGATVYQTPLWKFTAALVPSFFTFVMFLSVYRWIPNTQVTWAEAGWGALLATVCWRYAIIGFTWYVSSGLANYQLVYGTLATVIILMFWIYISSVIVLLGAHFSAAIAICRRLEKQNSD